MKQIRADHVGSLLRPPSLLAARRDYAEDRLERHELASAEDQAITLALQLQSDVGLNIYNDGEYRRRSFLSELADAVDGFSEFSQEMIWHGDESQADTRASSKVVTGKMTKRRRMTAHEVAFMHKHSPGRYKVTVPDLSYFPLSGWEAEVSASAYPQRIEMLDDLADIIRSEVESLLADGVTYIQLDSVGFTMLIDEEQRAWLASTGTDPDDYISAAIEAEIRLLEHAHREGATIAMHLCRGNSRGRWLASGGYEPIAARLFPYMPVDRWLLEYDTDRAGGFEPLRHIQPGTSVVLGLVSTKTSELEDSDTLMRRVDAASKYVPIENLALSPQCGFASVAEGNPGLTWDDQRRKLELVVSTAQRIWGDKG